MSLVTILAAAQHLSMHQFWGIKFQNFTSLHALKLVLSFSSKGEAQRLSVKAQALKFNIIKQCKKRKVQAKTCKRAIAIAESNAKSFKVRSAHSATADGVITTPSNWGRAARLLDPAALYLFVLYQVMVLDVPPCTRLYTRRADLFCGP
ncbi:hypothetical protein DFH09DRAFT_1086259 [Mycena vulgaris]|nr:hypothetical protein DFH09DRAFT_1086259 [Mycena vulgaris]